MLSDGARTFNAELIKEIIRLLGIAHITSTPLHSQGNAVVEKVNATIMDKLSMSINSNDSYNSDNWDEALPMVVFAISITRHTSTGIAPFELMYTRQPFSNFETTRSPNVTVYQLYAKLAKMHLDTIIQEAFISNKNVQLASKPYYDLRHRNVDFEIGDCVWVARKAARGKKLYSRYDGPYVVINKNQNVYDLQSEATNKVIKRHVSALKAYTRRHSEQETSSSDSEHSANTDQDNQNANNSSNSDTTMSQARASTSRAIAKILPILLILASSSLGQILRQESPLIWRQTYKVILRGSKS